MLMMNRFSPSSWTIYYIWAYIYIFLFCLFYFGLY